MARGTPSPTDRQEFTRNTTRITTSPAYMIVSSHAIPRSSRAATLRSRPYEPPKPGQVQGGLSAATVLASLERFGALRHRASHWSLENQLEVCGDTMNP